LKGIWFETKDDANGVTDSAVKITRNNNNNNNDTYVIEDYNEKNDNDDEEDNVITNKLGVQRNWSFLTYKYKIYSGTGGNDLCRLFHTQPPQPMPLIWISSRMGFSS
jgi:hypothetical protein